MPIVRYQWTISSYLRADNRCWHSIACRSLQASTVKCIGLSHRCKRQKRYRIACSSEAMPTTTKGSVISSPATPQRVGVLGGGQLGKMLGSAAASMGIRLKVLDPNENCPAAAVAEQVQGDFSDFDTVRRFVTDEDVLTVEIEHVDAEAMREVQEASGVDVEPTPGTLALIQDKFQQKEHFNHKGGLKMTSYIEISGEGTADLAGMVLGFPFMLKAKRMAYDGKGNAVVKSLGQLEPAMETLGGQQRGLYGEKWVNFTKEVAVMVARSRDGEVTSYPVTETIHRDSICYITQTPAQIPQELQDKARQIAEKAVGCLEGAGVFGVEMFVVEGGDLLLNEVAPRPHNSGHYTIEACVVSQFEQHLRAVLGLPLGSTELKVASGVMLNVLGEADGEEGELAAKSLLDKAYGVSGATVHWYGKQEVSKNRKLGHVTIVGNSAEETASKLAEIDPAAAEALAKSAAAFDEDWRKVLKSREEREGDSEGKSGSGPPVLAMAITPLSEASPSGQELSGKGIKKLDTTERDCGRVSASTVERPSASAQDQSEASTSGCHAEVGIIMGSDSDLATMRAAAETLQSLGVNCEVTIVSAHRTPDRMMRYARDAHARGLKVIIAGAGGAAHLPGMVAALTPLPVIGVPVKPTGSHLDGIDALLSIVQMPKGVPVATVGIGNSTNAGLLAARILAASNEHLLCKIQAHQEDMEQQVMTKVKGMENSGWESWGT